MITLILVPTTLLLLAVALRALVLAGGEEARLRAIVPPPAKEGEPAPVPPSRVTLFIAVAAGAVFLIASVAQAGAIAYVNSK